MAAPESNISARLTQSNTPVPLEELSKDESPKSPRPPWKGVQVLCAELRSYLCALSTFDRASMLRKGREVHKIYVDIMKGETFLDDQFMLTEFGRMVLQNGSIRAGRAKNAKQIVVARETLYCSGSGACKRACGGYGECLPGCDKAKMRGHKCSYRIKLTMRLGYVNYWFVEVLGDHQQIGKIEDCSELFEDCVSKYSTSPVNGDYNIDMGVNLPNCLASTLPVTLINSQSNGISSQSSSVVEASPLNLYRTVKAESVDTLVKVKEEPIDYSCVDDGPVDMSVSSSMQPTYNPIKQLHIERAKSRKRAHTYQVIHKNKDSCKILREVLTDREKNSKMIKQDLHNLVSKRGSKFIMPENWRDSADGTASIGSPGSVLRSYTETEWDSESYDNVEAEEDGGKDLMSRIHQLESHVKQLQNVVLKGQKDGSSDQKGKNKKTQKEFDFEKYNTRHIALKVAYLGWDYQGFAAQEDTDKTIETAIFDALSRTKLIESREVSNYHRCGRTDKGVSAFGQVISITVRSNLLEGPGVSVRDGGSAHDRPGDKTTEIRYVHILNKVLPPEIRVLAWAPVTSDFSARFNCKKRTYKYYFPKAGLDLELMYEASQKLLGEHDFRNLCKMDVGNGVVNFKRRIMSAEIKTLDERENGYQMCELTIVGMAFLWHQIRCIVAIIFLVGQGREKPEIIEELLDVEKNPRKPQYNMASEVPLVLFDSQFGNDLEWIYEADWHEDNIRHLQQLWAQHAVKATILKSILDEMDTARVETETDIAPWSDLSSPVLEQGEWLVPGNKTRVYKSLLERQTCESLEERIEHFAKRRKVAPEKADPQD
ncbi:hypothetical protein ScPMuIL_009583 [Solemya velum]